jgi:hypothetical protein
MLDRRKKIYFQGRLAMTRKTALIISTIVTTFVLLLALGVFLTVRSAAQVKAANEAAAASSDAAAASPSDATAQPALDPSLVQTIQDREAAYQELINQANARLAQAQQEQQALQAQLAAMSQPAITTTVASAPVAYISMEQAARLAATYLGRSDVYSVETVNSNGANVYQVTFSSGDVVYVSLDGNVLSVQRARGAAVTRPSHSDDDHEGGSEDHHSGGDDD